MNMFFSLLCLVLPTKGQSALHPTVGQVGDGPIRLCCIAVRPPNATSLSLALVLFPSRFLFRCIECVAQYARTHTLPCNHCMAKHIIRLCYHCKLHGAHLRTAMRTLYTRPLATIKFYSKKCFSGNGEGRRKGGGEEEEIPYHRGYSGGRWKKCSTVRDHDYILSTWRRSANCPARRGRGQRKANKQTNHLPSNE